MKGSHLGLFLGLIAVWVVISTTGPFAHPSPTPVVNPAANGVAGILGVQHPDDFKAAIASPDCEEIAPDADGFREASVGDVLVRVTRTAGQKVGIVHAFIEELPERWKDTLPTYRCKDLHSANAHLGYAAYQIAVR